MILNNIDMGTIGERLAEAMKLQGLTPYKLSNGTGVSQSTIGRILKNNGEPNRSTILTICSYMKIDPEYILTGENEDSNFNSSPNNLEVQPFIFETSSNKNSNKFISLPNGQYLMTMPLAETSVQAGFLDNFQDVEYLTDLPQHSIIVDKPVQGRYVAFRVSEHSMDNGRIGSIPSGYIVSARELQRQHWRDPLRYKRFPEWVIYTTQSSYPLLKQIVAHDVGKGIITCRSYNDDKVQYPDFDLSLDKVKALFYVIDVSRGGKDRDY